MTKPRAGLYSCGSSFRKPSHSNFPVPGTGSRPTQPFRFGVNAEACHAILPSTSPQIRFSDGYFQYIAAARNSRQLLACASRSDPRYAAVPGSSVTVRNAYALWCSASTWKIGPWREYSSFTERGASPLILISSLTTVSGSYFAAYITSPDAAGLTSS